MASRKDPSTGFAIFGLVLFIGPGIAFEMILFYTFGWQIAALPFLAAFALLGYRIAWPPVDGNAGTGGNGAGVPFALQIDPEDPDAGIPRQGA